MKTLLPKIFSYAFNGRAELLEISVRINVRGRTEIYLPGMPEPIIVIRGHPVKIEIGGTGGEIKNTDNGPVLSDMAILVEMYRLTETDDP